MQFFLVNDGTEEKSSEVSSSTTPEASKLILNLRTKYYRANVELVVHEISDCTTTEYSASDMKKFRFETVEALIYVVSERSLSSFQSVVNHWRETFQQGSLLPKLDVQIAALISNGNNVARESNSILSKVMDWASSEFFECIECNTDNPQKGSEGRDKESIGRVLQAIESHMWSNLVMLPRTGTADQQHIQAETKSVPNILPDASGVRPTTSQSTSHEVHHEEDETEKKCSPDEQISTIDDGSTPDTKVSQPKDSEDDERVEQFMKSAISESAELFKDQDTFAQLLETVCIPRNSTISHQIQFDVDIIYSVDVMQNINGTCIFVANISVIFNSDLYALIQARNIRDKAKSGTLSDQERRHNAANALEKALYFYHYHLYFVTCNIIILIIRIENSFRCLKCWVRMTMKVRMTHRTKKSNNVIKIVS